MIHRKVIHQITNLPFKAICRLWFRISVWALICQNLNMFSNNYSLFLQWIINQYDFFIHMYVWWTGFCNLRYKKCTYAFSFVTLMWWCKFYKLQTSFQCRSTVRHCILYTQGGCSHLQLIWVTVLPMELCSLKVGIWWWVVTHHKLWCVDC
jgi:hypothetical protein